MLTKDHTWDNLIRRDKAHLRSPTPVVELRKSHPGAAPAQPLLALVTPSSPGPSQVLRSLILRPCSGVPGFSNPIKCQGLKAKRDRLPMSLSGTHDTSQAMPGHRSFRFPRPTHSSTVAVATEAQDGARGPGCWGGRQGLPSGPCVRCFSGDNSARPIRSGGGEGGVTCGPTALGLPWWPVKPHVTEPEVPGLP